MPKYTIVDSPADNVIGLPPDVMKALGHPAELEMEERPDGVLLRLPGENGRLRPGTLEALAVARARMPKGIGFTEAQLATIRSASRAADERDDAATIAAFEKLGDAGLSS